MQNSRNLEKILKVLANKRRLLILGLLKNGKSRTVGEIAKEIKLSFRATSKHLVLLYSVEILDKNQVGLQMFYKISDDIKKDKLVSYLLSIL
jgi:DNA-binding transcriptional ArsR family regulator